MIEPKNNREGELAPLSLRGSFLVEATIQSVAGRLSRGLSRCSVTLVRNADRSFMTFARRIPLPLPMLPLFDYPHRVQNRSQLVYIPAHTLTR